MVVGATGASAADLEYERHSSGYRTERHSSVYEDHRYRDIYGPAPIPHKHAPRYYKTEPAPLPPIPHAHVYRDRELELDREPEPRSYGRPETRSYRPWDDGRRYHTACLPREEIKRKLVDEGWRDFTDLELRGNIARIEARRRNGDLFVLRVNRCSGNVVNAERLGDPRGRPYAYEHPPVRGPRSYY